METRRHYEGEQEREIDNLGEKDRSKESKLEQERQERAREEDIMRKTRANREH